MTKKLPALTDKQIIRKIRKIGFRFLRQGRGSHEIWVRDPDGRITVIPRHAGRIIKREIIKAIIEDTGLTIEEFNAL
jgi:predicted RNA binding protein YcfA (HicA-like mRNA interferase family)